MKNFVLRRDFCSQTTVLLCSYFPCDPPYVTDELRKAEAFQDSMDKLKTEMEALQNKMMNSVPFYSSRYKVTRDCDHWLSDDSLSGKRKKVKNNNSLQNISDCLR